MNFDLKKIAGGLILVIGLILFSASLIHNNLNLALVCITSSLMIWVIYGLLLDVFEIKMCAWVFSISGFLLSMSVFFIYAIEQVPHPIGAVVFHTGGIAGSLGIALFSLFPLLIIHQLNYANTKQTSDFIKNKKNSDTEPDIDADDWEFATEEDLQSGKFETG